MRLVFDIESDGLLDTITKIHCIVTYDIGTEEMKSFGPDKIEEGLEYLSKADVLIGHNIIKFDLPALKQVTGFEFDGEVIDTHNLSRLLFPQIEDQFDWIAYRKKEDKYLLPKKLFGSHKLEAWGYRLGFFKQESPDFLKFSQEMLEYCQQDVLVNVKIYHYLMSKRPTPESIDLECKFQQVMWEAEENGVYFNEKLAHKLHAEFSGESEKLRQEMQEIFPTLLIPETKNGKVVEFTPSRGNKTKGYVKGAVFSRLVTQEFNPNSDQQIAYRFKRFYKWVPKTFTKSGAPSLEDNVLAKLEYPIVKPLRRYKILQKRLSLLNGWFKKLTHEGKIHGWMFTNGAVTGRCTHKVIANIPRPDKPYGKEIRSLWMAPKGYDLVGCDAKGLELRLLAHYLAKWDGGEYVQSVLGDPHTANQKAAGLPTRDTAKTFIYALLYGGGDAKIGSIVKKGSAVGRKLKDTFFKNTPAIKKLIDTLHSRVDKKKPIVSIDGRSIFIRKKSASLNFLLQGAGALLMKRAAIIFKEKCIEEKYEWGKDVLLVIHYHDEFQTYAREEISEHVGYLANESIKAAGEYYNLRCPMEGDPKIGKNWSETH